jgi:uncharacterized membrane protein
MRTFLILAILCSFSLSTFASGSHWKTRLDEANFKSKVMEQNFSSDTDIGVAYETVEAQCMYEASLLGNIGSNSFYSGTTTVISSQIINGQLSVTFLCVAKKI